MTLMDASGFEDLDQQYGRRNIIHQLFPKTIGELNGFIIRRPRFNSDDGLEIELDAQSSYYRKIYAKYFPFDNLKGENKVRIEALIDNGYVGYQKSNHSYEIFFQKEGQLWVNKGPTLKKAFDEEHFSKYYGHNTTEYHAFETLIEFSRR